MKIQYSEEATGDLKEVFDYIKKGSLKFARIEVKSIKLFISRLKKDSYLGKHFDKFQNENVRLIIYKNYLIVYEISSPVLIEILTIHHHSRSFSRNPAIGEE